MRYLVDTHVLLWILEKPDQVPLSVMKALGAPGVERWAGMASLWEMRIKSGLGKLFLPEDLEVLLLDSGFDILPVNIAHTRAVERLPHHHRDPFDRMLIAQAKTEEMTLITADSVIPKYDVRVLWG